MLNQTFKTLHSLIDILNHMKYRQSKVEISIIKEAQFSGRMKNVHQLTTKIW